LKTEKNPGKTLEFHIWKRVGTLLLQFTNKDSRVHGVGAHDFMRSNVWHRLQ